MRVLLVSHEYPPVGGGAGVALRHLAQALVAAGSRVEVLSPGPPGRSEEEGVVVHRLARPSRDGSLPGPRDWLSFLVRGPGALRQRLSDLAPDVVHSFFVFPAGWVVARSATRVPHVTTAIGADIHDPTRFVSADRNPLVRWLAVHAARHAAAVVADSTDMARRAMALFPGREVETVALGMPKLTADGRGRRELGLAGQAFVVCTLARLVRRKRIELLLDAVAALGDEECVLVVMGAGPEEGRLREHALRLGIAARTRFTGRVSEADKAAYLANADLFCLPSDHEAFGLVLVEAMSLGTPVVATTGGGPGDIVRDGVDGFLVPPGDLRGLIARLRLLHQDRGALTAMREQAASRAAGFTPAHTAAAFTAIYRRVTGAGR